MTEKTPDPMAALQASAQASKALAIKNFEVALKLTIELLIEKPIYYELNISSEPESIAAEYLSEGSDLSFDTYCTSCKKESTFRIKKLPVPRKPPGGSEAAKVAIPHIFGVSAICQRSYHVYTYVFFKNGHHLIKIGQFPSLATISHGELRSIDKGLEKTDRKELGTALGLFAHGTSLGAFVYLRRVFERMIIRAHERQSLAGSPVAGFSSMRMEEKIAALKSELPDRVVQNSGVFSVLSAGLHELTEEQCTKHFPIMKAVLFQMLEQEEHKRLAMIKASETEAALQKIISDPHA